MTIAWIAHPLVNCATSILVSLGVALLFSRLILAFQRLSLRGFLQEFRCGHTIDSLIFESGFNFVAR